MELQRKEQAEKEPSAKQSDEVTATVNFIFVPVSQPVKNKLQLSAAMRATCICRAARRVVGTIPCG